MAVPFLVSPVQFPPVIESDGMGVVAIGGDLTPATLLQAYSRGIFPWFSDFDPYPVWWSPLERMVLIPGQHKVSKSMRQVLNKNQFRFSTNEAFAQVIQACADIPRADQDGTWITEEMIDAYINMHELGFATSYEVWEGDALVGGLYGVAIGNLFCGESMFSTVSNASKFAFIKMSESLEKEGIVLIDCQNHTPHLESLGAKLISRENYLELLSVALKDWTLG